MKKTLFTILLLSSVFLQAQSFVISNVTLFDGETIHQKVDVIVVDGMISEVGKNTDANVVTNDGTGKFLMPAMTNSHVHAFMQPNLSEAANAGVLNVLDMHGMEQFQGVMQKTSFENSSLARYFYAGSAATAPEGHGTQFGFPVPTLTEATEAEDFVTARIAAGANHIKIIVEPWKATLKPDVVKALIEAAHSQNKKAVIHISKVNDAIHVIENNADGLVHIWWDASATDDQLQAMAETGSFIIPTVLTSHLALNTIRESAPKGAFLSNDAITNEVKRAYDAGIPILAGTDPPNANINYGTDLYKELDLLSKAGIPNIDVLKSATSLPAKHFDLEKIGYIKKGYYADMVLLNADPILDIQNISNINTIWKKGEIVRTSEK